MAEYAGEEKERGSLQRTSLSYCIDLKRYMSTTVVAHGTVGMRDSSWTAIPTAYAKGSGRESP
ncbi:hypothetical protein NITMOv2_1900 [Nitrospira moscoviensis]|uniref:Uncharacterized protein n=1 Tax=Nitrospira moscoviensis TaxID=42253 RepID=A0A0K2GBJ2_NITMO|nr:hypothetical protein NITMOv2_1900 [Nitrospira moscoviensis]